MKQGQGSRRSRGQRSTSRRPNFHGRGSTVESNGPEGKIRGTVHQVIEKYQALARDATASGDRVAAENFYQHAEHYQRVVTANGWDQQPRNEQPRNEQRPDQQRSDQQRPDNRPEQREARPSGNGADNAAEGAGEQAATATEAVEAASTGEPDTKSADADEELAPAG